MTVKQFILLGLPGARVKEHAIALAKSWNLPCISLPELADAAAAQAIGSPIETGQPMSDELCFKHVRRQLEQPDAMFKGWVLAGFPQSVAQTQRLNDWLAAVGQPPAMTVYLKTMTGILMNRLSAETDESVPVLRRQLTRQQDALAPVLDYYKQQAQLKTLNGNLSFEEVAHELFQLGHDSTGAARFIKDEAELDALLAEQSLMVVDCMASWCGSCKQVTPLIDQLATAYGDRVNVMKIDFDANQRIPERFGLKGMPAVMFFKDGELQETLTGVKPYQAYSAVVSRFLG
ncbi:MAG: nucleoside monophosphate kinase [Cyanobacteria bacterium J06632_22]